MVTVILLIVGCATKDRVTFDHTKTNITEAVTFNGQPISLDELYDYCETIDYGDADLFVVTINGVEKSDLKEWDEGMSDMISLFMSFPDT